MHKVHKSAFFQGWNSSCVIVGIQYFHANSAIQNTMFYSYAYIEKFSIPTVSSIVLPNNWMVLVNILTTFSCELFSSNFHQTILSCYPFPWLLSGGPALTWPEYSPPSGKLQNVQEGRQEFWWGIHLHEESQEIQIRFQISWTSFYMISRVINTFFFLWYTISFRS